MSPHVIDTLYGLFVGTLVLSLKALPCLALIVAFKGVLGKWMPGRWHYLLWFVLMVRLIVPWDLLQARFAPLAAGRSWTTSMVGRSFASPEHASPGHGVLDGQDVSPSLEPAAMASVGVERPGPVMTDSRHWKAAAATLWIAGFGALLIGTLVRHRRSVRDLTCTAEMAPDWVVRLFTEVRGELGLTVWPMLLVSDRAPSPVLIGAIRPKVVLPRNWVERSSPEEMRYSLMHELLHLRGGDIWISGVWTAIIAVHWFNPFLWWAGTRMTRDRELACDERVLRREPAKGAGAYCRALLTAATHMGRSPSAWPLLGQAGIVERKSHIERRIQMMIRTQARGKTRLSLAGISAVILAALAFTGPSGAVVSAEMPANPFATNDDENDLARLRDQAIARGEYIRACEAEIRRVRLRREQGHAYEDKIGFVKIVEAWDDGGQSVSLAAQQQLLKDLEKYQEQHAEDPDYGWRVQQLCAAIAERRLQLGEARAHLGRAIDLYPYTRYSSPRQHSRFQHLLNSMAMLIWDEEGFEAAQSYMVDKWQNDRRFLYFFDGPWRKRLQDLDPELLVNLRAQLTEKPYRPPRQVTVVLTPDGIHYDGKAVDWQVLEAYLGQLDDRFNYYLGLGISTNEMTIARLDAAKAEATWLVQKLGLGGPTYIGPVE